MISGHFTSAARGGVVTGWSLAFPPGTHAGRLHPLIALHGRGGTHRDSFDGSLHLDRYLAALSSAGHPPFAIASVDGGDHGYWHPRQDSDPAAMVLNEFLPLLAGQGLDTSRIAFLGWSMGGYEALYLAGRLGAGRVAAAAAESPALWRSGSQSAAGAFDDVADFDRHAIFGRLNLLSGIALRIDCGDRDGFAPITRDLRAALDPTPAGGIEPGGHDAGFWRSQAQAQLSFVGRHLAS
ncbi:esterase family protein [Jatrophihabitans telluris]|uniref:Esterase family protein n=1 Tax=Jatrophihabitans telluris TaxID=2038343 RepID=A0ABY4QWK3_9ACTN|nr:esterase family protein [Jatrophihabitans telluris]UQX88053.1 esterase family protein [Jatrophihabitans telluris]